MIRVLALLSLALLFSSSMASVANCKNRNVQVFTDIDDTLKSPSRSTRFVGGGIDYAWARNHNLENVIYPGMLAFEVMLSKGASGVVSDEKGIVWLSSRPDELIKLTGSKFAGGDVDLGLKSSFGVGVRDALYGSVDYLVPGETSRYTLFGLGKAFDFNSFTSTHSNENACYHFVGDNGQGDVLTGVEIQKHANAGAVFIHTVKLTGAELEIDTSKQDSFFYFFSAMGASLQAHCAGYITKNAVKFVRESIRTSPQRGGCLQRCSPKCLPLIDKCLDDDCAADPDTGYAPGCGDLLCELEIADRFLDGRLTCDEMIPHIDATPSYAGRRTTSRQCNTLDDMAAYESTKSADIAILSDRCSCTFRFWEAPFFITFFYCSYR